MISDCVSTERNQSHFWKQAGVPDYFRLLPPSVCASDVTSCEPAVTARPSGRSTACYCDRGSTSCSATIRCHLQSFNAGLRDACRPWRGLGSRWTWLCLSLLIFVIRDRPYRDPHPHDSHSFISARSDPTPIMSASLKTNKRSNWCGAQRSRDRAPRSFDPDTHVSSSCLFPSWTVFSLGPAVDYIMATTGALAVWTLLSLAWCWWSLFSGSQRGVFVSDKVVFRRVSLLRNAIFLLESSFMHMGVCIARSDRDLMQRCIMHLLFIKAICIWNILCPIPVFFWVYRLQRLTHWKYQRLKTESN